MSRVGSLTAQKYQRKVEISKAEIEVLVSKVLNDTKLSANVVTVAVVVVVVVLKRFMFNLDLNF